MKSFFLRSFVFGCITLVVFPIGTWAYGEKAYPITKFSPVINTGSSQKQQLDIKNQEQQQAVEEVNMLILDSYKTLLDKILDQLFINIAEASKGDKGIQVRALSKVRDNLDQKLDSLDEESITPNRKKILQGVYFYLKSNVEIKIQDLQKK